MKNKKSVENSQVLLPSQDVEGNINNAGVCTAVVTELNQGVEHILSQELDLSNVSEDAIKILTAVRSLIGSLRSPMSLKRAMVMADCSGRDFSGLDFSGRDLKGITFAQAKLSGCNFKEVDMGLLFIESNEWWNDEHLPMVSSLLAADLTGAILELAKLDYVDFRRAKLIGANLRHASCTSADFSGADLAGAILDFTDLRGADLRDALGIELKVLSRAIVDEETKLPVGFVFDSRDGRVLKVK